MTGPLEDRTIVVTRAAADGDELTEELAARGGTVLHVPSISFDAAPPDARWDEVLGSISSASHVVFTSPRAVRFFTAALDRDGIASQRWSHAHIAAIGESTRHAAENCGFRVDQTPGRTTAAGLAQDLIELGDAGPGSLVVVPGSDIARQELGETLRRAGARVLETTVYVTSSAPEAGARAWREHVATGGIVDAVTFASPSAVRGFLALVGDESRELLEGAAVVTIGPTTSAAATAAGLDVAAEANDASARALAEAVRRVIGGT